MSVWRDLALYLAIGIAAATLVVTLDGFVSLRIDPALALLTGVVVAAAFWTYKHIVAAGDRTEWQQPSWHPRSSHLQADVRTRRLAAVLTNAQPGRGFDARGVARQLARLTASRLVNSGRIPRPTGDEDPLADADLQVSAALLNYLRSAETERPQVLNRKTLHAHLKEIDSL